MSIKLKITMLKTHLIIFVASLLLIASCNDKPEKQDIIVPAPKAEVKKGPQQMPPTRQERDVDWLGKEYSVSVLRTADKTLPLVKDENGQEYYDNTIDVKILRTDGTEAFHKKFTKQSFASYAGNSSLVNEGVLLGIVFDKVKDGNIVFAVSVGSPDMQSDAFIPLVMKVDRMGNLSISLDTQIDTNAENGSDEEDGV
ncbi:MAG: DUF4738 domain-containing protein [Bacteroidales bacterium]|nr:DUF4738 domain-containing protein [Bacteroidales bacterium]MCM1146703.1 DUF4738 domain-containing protein [Bacteroidales bacterium]MCM1205520.1 DUF4738 domain-containing protein [Bacillota bacterium]MCM1509219.1 DUF4738 domain-containing protein [Clostridium sp.]